MKTKSLAVLALILLSAFNSQFTTARAQGTNAFTYQGQLHDNGTNANGNYTMIFSLYDAVTSGNLVAGPVTNSVVLANGLFSINLNFGAGAFNGAARWLDITITNGGVTQVLSPRVQVLPAPYALFAAVAATVTNAAIMNAQLAGNAVAATNIASGQVVKSLNGLTDSVGFTAGANSTLFTNGNTLQLSASIPNVQYFFSNGTFVVPTNVTRIMVELWGGGGGGGGSSSANLGGGGGAGGYAVNIFNVVPGTSYTITTGTAGTGGVVGSAGTAGGTTSFDVLMSATGGSGGGFGSTTPGMVGFGGAGGSATGSLISGLTGGSGLNGNQTGLGGGVWRGGDVGGNGPGAGGSSGLLGDAGSNGKRGALIVYY